MRKPNVLSRNTSCTGPTRLTILHTNTLANNTYPLYRSHTHPHLCLKFSRYQRTGVVPNVIVKLTRRPVLWDPLHRNSLFTIVNSRGLAIISKPLKPACSSQIVPDHLWEDPRQLRCRAHCVQNANKQTHGFCPLSWTELYPEYPIGRAL